MYFRCRSEPAAGFFRIYLKNEVIFYQTAKKQIEINVNQLDTSFSSVEYSDFRAKKYHIRPSFHWKETGNCRFYFL
jgi:hypothetical protein